MLRAFLVILAILIAVLAIVFDRPWLYAGAIVPLLGVLGLLGWRLWESYRGPSRREKVPSSDFSSRTDSLEDVGIMDVRPQDRSEKKEEQKKPEEEKPQDHWPDAAATSPGEGSREEGFASTEGEESPPSSNGRRRTSKDASASVEGDTEMDGDPVLVPLMRSLRSALGAQTVCLLLQEEVLLTYQIEALDSAHSSVRSSGSFDTQVPLLTAGMSRQPVTVRDLSSSKVSIDDLNYYERPPQVDHVAVAPVPRPDDPVSYFLLADSSGTADLGSSRARFLLEHFAETAALLLDSDRQREETEEVEVDRPTNGQSSLDAPSEEVESSEAEEDRPRPRREIIAEEMKAAEAASEELALILVHLNRAESIARRGEASVESAERLFRARLEQLAPNQRVERFGELTYGIFFRGGIEAVEPWAADLQDVLDEETGELEGGVSIGVAVWVARHDDPESLRTDATEALWEAYETGTCTIVA